MRGGGGVGGEKWAGERKSTKESGKPISLKLCLLGRRSRRNKSRVQVSSEPACAITITVAHGEDCVPGLLDVCDPAVLLDGLLVRELAAAAAAISHSVRTYSRTPLTTRKLRSKY